MTYEITTDDVTVWVNGGPSGMMLGRFGKMGIDIHQTFENQQKLGKQCLFCTMGVTTAADWETFKTKMHELHGVVVTDAYKPVRFQ